MPPSWRDKIHRRRIRVDQRYERLDLMYNFNGAEQHLFPVVLLGGEDVVLVDCG